MSNKSSGGDSNQWKREIQDVASWIPASLRIPPLWARLCQHSNKWKGGLSRNTTLTCRDGTCPSITHAPTHRGLSQHDGSQVTYRNKPIKILLNIFQTPNYVYTVYTVFGLLPIKTNQQTKQKHDGKEHYGVWALFWIELIISCKRNPANIRDYSVGWWRASREFDHLGWRIDDKYEATANPRVIQVWINAGSYDKTLKIKTKPRWGKH